MHTYTLNTGSIVKVTQVELRLTWEEWASLTRQGADLAVILDHGDFITVIKTTKYAVARAPQRPMCRKRYIGALAVASATAVNPLVGAFMAVYGLSMASFMLEDDLEQKEADASNLANYAKKIQELAEEPLDLD